MSQNTSPDNVPSATKGTADSLAAPGRVGAGGTNSLELFRRWLEAAAHDAHRAYENPPADLSGQDLRLHLEGCEIAWLDCDVAMRLLMAFKLEQRA